MRAIQLYNEDCLVALAKIPDGTVDLVLTDPPYNIGIAEWDKINGYIDWCMLWLKECQRVLKPSGVLYFWHNDMGQIAELMHEIKRQLALVFVSFCIWDKGDAYRARAWANRRPDSKTALRSWFNVCEYCLHFFNAPDSANAAWGKTGLDRINSNPECYKPLKEWYAAEKKRLGITEKEIGVKYTEVTGKQPHMLRHYFQDSQFAIPTKQVWESVYESLGFGKSYEELRQSYEELRQSYEELRQSYEELRNVHKVDAAHCNVWHRPPIPSNNRIHTCEKPVDLLERLICVSSQPGGTVLDCFMGVGSTGVACVNTGRDFIGIDNDKRYFEVAQERIDTAGRMLYNRANE